MQLHHIALVCKSEADSDRFYRNVLGLEKKQGKQISAGLMSDIFQISTAARIVNYAENDLWFEIFITDTAEDTPVSHHCLSVTDRKALLEKCAANNVIIREIPKKDGTRLVFIEDYDHNQFEIKEIKP